MSILVRYAPPSLTREQYDKVNEILQENGPDADCAVVFEVDTVCGEAPDTFCVVL